MFRDIRDICLATLVLVLSAAALPACGAPPPPPPKPAAGPPPAPAPEAVDPGPVTIESDIGGLNEQAMERAFSSLDHPVQACFDDGTRRIAVMGGGFRLKMRIDRDGRARWAYLSESTLGDRETEACVLGLVRDKQWPKPVGGEGLAERAYEVDPRTQPAELDAKWVRPALAKARQEAWACRKGVRGKFIATAYVRPDGRVIAVGVAPPNEAGEAIADCIVEKIRKIRFGKPGKRVKLIFEIW